MKLLIHPFDFRLEKEFEVRIPVRREDLFCNAYLVAFALTLAGILATVGFWRNPELLFGSWLERVRDSAFEEKATEYRVLADIKRFSVDWAAGRRP